VKNLRLFALTLIVFLSFLYSAYAAEVLDDWQEWVFGNVTFTKSGTSVNIIASGLSDTYSWGKIEKEFATAVGVIGDVKVTAVSGHAMAGLRKYIGKTQAGNYILAEIYLLKHESNYGIQFNVRERDQNDNEIDVLARGYLGNFRNEWGVNQTITLGFVHLGNEMAFYSPGTGAFIKVKVFENLSPFDGDSGTGIFSWANQGTENSISSTVSNINIIYPNNLGVFSDAFNRKKVVVIPLVE
jgi:hypothetical protein